MEFEPIDQVTVDPAAANVYEHGWQSWSPTTTYAVTGTSARPHDAARLAISYRPGRPAPATGFQGEGLLAVDCGHDEVHLYAATDPTDIPSIRATLDGGTLRVTATGSVETTRHATLDGALAGWADRFAAAATVAPIRAAPTAWCSWYHYFTDVTEADIRENLDAVGAADLPVDVVQIDDGWESEIGDWLTLSSRFSSLGDIVGRIRSAGRRAGIWVAPFLVGSHSTVARDHPDWLIPGHSAGHNWHQDLYGLDTTHPGAVAYLGDTFSMLRDLGIDYFKIDFLYAGALDGARHSGAAPLAAYRAGIRLIREVIGTEAYLLGCGAPILPSVGLGFDAMRVGADTAPHYAPRDGDPSQPSQYGATLTTIGRAFQHGRFWVNDPDCLIVRPAVERREEWATVVERYGGLRASSDRIADLDPWGLDVTRRLLTDVPPPTPF